MSLVKSSIVMVTLLLILEYNSAMYKKSAYKVLAESLKPLSLINYYVKNQNQQSGVYHS
jgi:hypothetical protein